MIANDNHTLNEKMNNNNATNLTPSSKKPKRPNTHPAPSNYNTTIDLFGPRKPRRFFTLSSSEFNEQRHQDLFSSFEEYFATVQQYMTEICHKKDIKIKEKGSVYTTLEVLYLILNNVNDIGVMIFQTFDKNLSKNITNIIMTNRFNILCQRLIILFFHYLGIYPRTELRELLSILSTGKINLDCFLYPSDPSAVYDNTKTKSTLDHLYTCLRIFSHQWPHELIKVLELVKNHLNDEALLNLKTFYNERVLEKMKIAAKADVWRDTEYISYLAYHYITSTSKEEKDKLLCMFDNIQRRSIINYLNEIQILSFLICVKAYMRKDESFNYPEKIITTTYINCERQRFLDLKSVGKNLMSNFIHALNNYNTELLRSYSSICIKERNGTL
jgi:hypothetical protein